MSALELPSALEAHEPPEARGADRADVAMLVATRHDLGLAHARFRELPRFLSAGDLLVVNTSATLPAALDARLGEQAVAAPALDADARRHLARRAANERSAPGRGRPSVRASSFPAAPTPSCSRASPGSDRLSVARLELDVPLEDYLRRHGRPIRYGYVPEPWPLEPTRPSSPASPAAPRCRAPAGPSPRSSWRSSSRAACSSRPCAPHGRLLARARRATLPRALSRAGHDGQARQRRPRLGRAGDRGRDDRRPRARDRGGGDGTVSEGQGWTIWS